MISRFGYSARSTVSIFKYLEGLYKCNTLSFTSQWSRFREESIREYLAKHPDCQTMSCVIEKAHAQLDRDLHDHEVEITRRFVVEERDKALAKAKEFLHRAARNYYDCLDVGYQVDLRHAGEWIGRGIKALRLESRLCPDDNIMNPLIEIEDANTGYEALEDEFLRLREELHLRWESPQSCFDGLLQLHLDLKEAVRKENYEKAAELRDEIRYVMDEADMDNL